MSLRTLAASLFVAVGLAATVRGQCQEAKLVASDSADHEIFGGTVAIAGDTVAVGCPFDDNAGGGDAGSVYLFTRGGGWPENQKLMANDAAPADRFASQVALSDETLVAGSQFGSVNGNHWGAAYVFRRGESTWLQESKLFASDASTETAFGFAVDVDGDWVACGAPSDNATGSSKGAVYLFRRFGSSWSQQAKLIPSDAATGDEFGSSVSLNGEVLVVGSRLDDDAGLDAGSAYVFRRHDGAWTQEAKLTPANAIAVGWFGESVSVDGDFVLVGAPYSGLNDVGSASVFRRVGSTWVPEVVLTASPTIPNAYFGESVSIRGLDAAVGAPRGSSSGVPVGAVYLFRRDLAGWHLETTVFASDGIDGDWFGVSAALGDGELVAGAPFKAGTGGAEAGAAYVFSTEGPTTYCVAKTNSQGCEPVIASEGSPTLGGANDFTVIADSVINNSNGMLLWSMAPDQIPFAGGFLCLHSPLVRTPFANSGGNPPPSDCSGSYSFFFSHAYMTSHGWAPGTRVHAQFLSRDQGFAPPNNVGLTNAIRFTICP